LISQENDLLFLSMKKRKTKPQPKQKDRIPWDLYFMKIAGMVAERSTCLRRKVGAVLVQDRRILATGYNGAPKSVAHCEEVGCLREKLFIKAGERIEICRGVHAEQNALVQAASIGIKVGGSTLYCTHQPCITCTKLLINADISGIYVKKPYPDSFANKMLKEAGVVVQIIK
jgi:dCMP deaminase